MEPGTTPKAQAASTAPGARPSPGATSAGHAGAPAALQGAPPLGITWPMPPTDLHVDGAEAHVLAFALDVSPDSLDRLAPVLSVPELERARRFHFEVHRNRFMVGRAALRLVLGRFLLAHPATLEFSYGPNGKPALAGAFAAHGWHFNLAHSENLAVLAVTRTGPVGVDVEYLHRLPDAEELVARFFSARESTAYRHLEEVQRTVAFFNLWTRKEAWLKATGDGIGHLLNQVEVSFLPGEPAQLLQLPESLLSQAGSRERPEMTNWSLYALTPAPGFAAALALAAPISRLHCWRWDDAHALLPMRQGKKVSAP